MKITQVEAIPFAIPYRIAQVEQRQHLVGPFPDGQVLLSRRPGLRPDRLVTIVVPDAAARPEMPTWRRPVGGGDGNDEADAARRSAEPGGHGALDRRMVLQAHGIRTLTCLAGRSERTRALAADAGFEDTASLAELVQRVDILLCVLVPDRAAGVADEVAAAVRATGAGLLYADCNAVSPQTVRAIAQTLEDAGARFVDVGIVGPPPVVTGSTGSATRFHASGSGSAELAALGSYGLDVRVVGPEVGQASGLKMCYGALTKGLQALGTELLVAAEMLGLAETLRVEQEESVPELLGWLRRLVPSMPSKAYRWVGEMEEIARTFDELGLTPGILEGAADLYAFVAETPLAHESPESRDRTRDLDAVVAVLARNAAQRASAARPAVPTRET